MWTSPIVFLTATPTVPIGMVAFYRGCEVVLGSLIGGVIPFYCAEITNNASWESEPQKSADAFIFPTLSKPTFVTS